MNTMKKPSPKLTPLRYAILAAAFTACFTACAMSPFGLSVYSLKDAEKKLAEFDYGYSPDKPIYLSVYMNLGDLSQPDNNYLRLLEVIGKSGKYVRLSLGNCKMGGTTVFTSPPLNKAARGMDKIVSISLPYVTESIEADINGRSPFFFYKNLKGVGAGEALAKIDDYAFADYTSLESVGFGARTIGDYAFAGCKNLKSVDFREAKTIGKGAFRGCENLKRLREFNCNTVGDYAFYDCGSLEEIRFPNTPPVLGEAVFLGSTPSSISLFISDIKYITLFFKWLYDNASKFNNGGKDIVVR